MEHTKLPWKIGHALSQNAVGIFSDTAQDGETVNAVCLISETINFTEEDEANAAFIVKACNNHAQLVDALETLIALHNYQESEGPKPTYEQWKTAFESAQETLNNLKP